MSEDLEARRREVLHLLRQDIEVSLGVEVETSRTALEHDRLDFQRSDFLERGPTVCAHGIELGFERVDHGRGVFTAHASSALLEQLRQDVAVEYLEGISVGQRILGEVLVVDEHCHGRLYGLREERTGIRTGRTDTEPHEAVLRQVHPDDSLQHLSDGFVRLASLGHELGHEFVGMLFHIVVQRPEVVCHEQLHCFRMRLEELTRYREDVHDVAVHLLGADEPHEATFLGQRLADVRLPALGKFALAGEEELHGFFGTVCLDPQRRTLGGQNFWQIEPSLQRLQEVLTGTVGRKAHTDFLAAKIVEARADFFPADQSIDARAFIYDHRNGPGVIVRSGVQDVAVDRHHRYVSFSIGERLHARGVIGLVVVDLQVPSVLDHHAPHLLAADHEVPKEVVIPKVDLAEHVLGHGRVFHVLSLLHRLVEPPGQHASDTSNDEEDDQYQFTFCSHGPPPVGGTPPLESSGGNRRQEQAPAAGLGLFERQRREVGRLGQHVLQGGGQLSDIRRLLVGRDTGLIERMLRPDAEPDRIDHDRRFLRDEADPLAGILAVIGGTIRHDDDVVLAVPELQHRLRGERVVGQLNRVRDGRATVRLGCHELRDEARGLLRRVERNRHCHFRRCEPLEPDVGVVRDRPGELLDGRLRDIDLGAAVRIALARTLPAAHGSRMVQDEQVIPREQVARLRARPVLEGRPGLLDAGRLAGALVDGLLDHRLLHLRGNGRVVLHHLAAVAADEEEADEREALDALHLTPPLTASRRRRLPPPP